jgi:hypothetical protein
MILNPTLILDAAMWLTAIAGLAVAAGQVWELLRTRSANVLVHEGPNSDLDRYAKLESDLAKLLELHEHGVRHSISEKISSSSSKRPTYRISIQYERGRFEFLVLLASNKVIDQWKWSEAEGVIPAKQGSNVDSEIVEARRAIMRDLAGKLGVTHG